MNRPFSHLDHFADPHFSGGLDDFVGHRHLAFTAMLARHGTGLKDPNRPQKFVDPHAMGM
jgi:hypothetical protein